MLVTTAIPNKIGSYGIKVGVYMPCIRGWYAIFSVETLFFLRIFMPYNPSFYGIFVGRTFCK